MKRFCIFAGSQYYPCGGWNDFKGSFDTEEEALEYLNGNHYNWWHVVDLEEGRVCNRSK